MAKPHHYCHPAKFSSTILEKETALTGPRTNFRASFVFLLSIVDENFAG